MKQAAGSDPFRQWTRPRAAKRLLWLLVFAPVTFLSCGPAWVYTFVEAENLAKRAEKPILVFYRDHLDVKSTAAQETPSQPEIMPLLKDFVLCGLVSAYDPNRRYVFQYGIASAPALIIVHPDGTYHALTQELSPERIRGFLAGTKPPGRRPQVDIQIPRPADYLVRAEGIYEKALDKARRQNRKLFIVYKWWLDADSTEMISNRLNRPEVASRCTETVNCVLDWDYIPNRSHVARYGVTKFPALIVVHQNGTFHAREGLGSVDEIVRFLTRALSAEGGPAHPQSPRTARGWNWSAYHNLARARAMRADKGLFIFYHSLVEDESARMMRLLNTPTVTNLFADTVNCSLDWSDTRNRQVMRRYGVDRTPAFIVVRPDGTFRVRHGAQTVADLRALHQFLVRR